MENVIIDNLIIMSINKFNKLQEKYPSIDLEFAIVKELDDRNFLISKNRLNSILIF